MEGRRNPWRVYISLQPKETSKAMNETEQRIRLTIGNLVIENAALAVRAETAEARVKELEAAVKPPAPPPAT